MRRESTWHKKKPASRSGAKKKKPDTAAKRAVEREPAKIPVRQILAGACFLLTVLALFACLGFQGLHPCRRKKPAGRTGGACGLLPVSGFVRISAGSAAVWQPSPGGVAQSGSLPVCGCSLCDCPFVWEAGGLYPVALPWWVSCSAPAEPEPVAASWGDSREFCLSWP